MLPHEILWIPLVPLISALFLVLFGKRVSERAAVGLACAAPLASLLVGLAALRTIHATGSPLAHVFGRWIDAGDFQIDFALRVDALSSVMILVVAGVGFLIHVYSIGYMQGDPAKVRYFSYLNLFVAMMLILVTAGNLPLLFMGWEGVGLCSYLLIGFWYEQEEKAAAGLKAFLVNKIADVAFLGGMLMLAVRFGTLDIPSLEARAETGLSDPGLMRLALLLLFVGACGKSAQIFLHVWLPDAMAGPTPVSALIHAATMVTAGAYLVARMHFLFALDPLLCNGIAVVGAITTLYAGLTALAQTDIKKVLAYSTISQLGILFLGLGLSAFPLSIFHLVTHAFFKALLFLSAGSVIHALHGEQEITRMGPALWRRIPTTFALATAGVLSVSMFPFAGFVSEHQILHLAHEQGPVISALVLAGSLLTPLYLARWWILVFFRSGEAHHGTAPHESPAVMTVPMGILAVLAIFGGLLNWPAEGRTTLASHLHPVFPHWEKLFAPMDAFGVAEGVLLFPLAALAFFGYYGLRERPRTPAFLREMLANGFYIDEFFSGFVVRPVRGGAMILWAFADFLLIDGLVNLAGGAPALVSAGVRRLQDGAVATGLWWALGGFAGLTLWLTWMR